MPVLSDTADLRKLIDLVHVHIHPWTTSGIAYVGLPHFVKTLASRFLARIRFHTYFNAIGRNAKPAAVPRILAVVHT
jgi:hypothetical protein